MRWGLACEQEVESYDDKDRDPADPEPVEVVGRVAHFRTKDGQVFGLTRG
jgi:hypothetical protein